MGDKLKQLLKQGEGIFLTVVIFLSKITANGDCLHLLVRNVLLLWYSLLKITACTTAQIGGCTVKRKASFATISFKKGRWAYFPGKKF